MSAAAHAYYRVPRRGCHLAIAFVLLVIVGLPALAWATADRWLPAVPDLLDADRPLANADVLVLKAAGESDDAVREAAQAYAAGGTRQIVVLGRVFTPDDLVPPTRNRRREDLARLGVPSSAVVEIDDGDDLYEEMTALRAAAADRGWRRIMFYVDELGGRRNLIVADRVLGPGGRAIGQVTFPLSWFSRESWWRGGVPRTIVFVRATQLVITAMSSRA